MRDDQARFWRGAEFVCQGDQAPGLVAGDCLLGLPNGRNFGPHQCSVHRVEAQQEQGIEVTAEAQAFIDKLVGQPRLPMRYQIHVGKGPFAGGVDPAQVLAEFDAVKHLDMLVNEHQVGQMQVTMAFAQQTGLAA